MTYTDYAPGITDMIASGEITEEVAINSRNMGMLLAGFIHLEMQREDIRDMFGTNDRTRFVEGLQASVDFRSRFAQYVASFA